MTKTIFSWYPREKRLSRSFGRSGIKIPVQYFRLSRLMASYLTTSVCGFSQLSDLCSFCSVFPLDRVGFIFIVHPQPATTCKSFLSFCRASEPCRYKSNQATPPAFEDYICSPHQHKSFVVLRSPEKYHFGLDSTGGILEFIQASGVSNQFLFF